MTSCEVQYDKSVARQNIDVTESLSGPGSGHPDCPRRIGRGAFFAQSRQREHCLSTLLRRGKKGNTSDKKGWSHSSCISVCNTRLDASDKKIGLTPESSRDRDAPGNSRLFFPAITGTSPGKKGRIQQANDETSPIVLQCLGSLGHR